MFFTEERLMFLGVGCWSTYLVSVRLPFQLPTGMLVFDVPVGRWEHLGQAKICVKCPTTAEMFDIQAKAQAAGIVNHLVVSCIAGHGCRHLLRVLLHVRLAFSVEVVVGGTSTYENLSSLEFVDL